MRRNGGCEDHNRHVTCLPRGLQNVHRATQINAHSKIKIRLGRTGNHRRQMVDHVGCIAEQLVNGRRVTNISSHTFNRKRCIHWRGGSQIRQNKTGNGFARNHRIRRQRRRQFLP